MWFTELHSANEDVLLKALIKSQPVAPPLLISPSVMSLMQDRFDRIRTHISVDVVKSVAEMDAASITPAQLKSASVPFGTQTTNDDGGANYPR
jgi:hypothetical protein